MNAATTAVHPYKLASVLLQYPTVALFEGLDHLDAMAAACPRGSRKPFVRFLSWLRATSPHEVAQHYVETFDLRRRCALYLAYVGTPPSRRSVASRHAITVGTALSIVGSTIRSLDHANQAHHNDVRLPLIRGPSPQSHCNHSPGSVTQGRKTRRCPLSPTPLRLMAGRPDHLVVQRPDARPRLALERLRVGLVEHEPMHRNLDDGGVANSAQTPAVQSGRQPLDRPCHWIVGQPRLARHLCVARSAGQAVGDDDERRGMPARGLGS